MVAWSPAGPAAFVLGASLGLQFHPESTPEIGVEWARLDSAQLERLGIDGPGLLDVDANGARAASMHSSTPGGSGPNPP